MLAPVPPHSCGAAGEGASCVGGVCRPLPLPPLFTLVLEAHTAAVVDFLEVLNPLKMWMLCVESPFFFCHVCFIYSKTEKKQGAILFELL